MLVPLTELFNKDPVNIAQHIVLNMNMHIVHTGHRVLHQTWPTSV
jgi:hypothetical protein